MDVNADGLPDRVYVRDNNIYVKYNTGNGFSAEKLLCSNQTAISRGSSTTRGMNGEFTVGGTAVLFKFTVSPTFNAGWTISRDEAYFTDFNNDGFPDIVRNAPNSESGNLIVRYAKPKPVNMLIKITSATNLETKIAYKMSGHSTDDNPHRNWEMASCITGFECDSKNFYKQKRTFEYDTRKYNRFERDDYGYQKVITKHYNYNSDNVNFNNINITDFNSAPVSRIIEDIYDIDNYLSKGLKLSSTLKSAGNKVFTKQIYTYLPKEIASGNLITDSNAHCLGGAWLALSTETTRFFESTDSTSAKTEYTHGRYGNVKSFKEFSNANSSPDVYSTDTISYHRNMAEYIVGIVKEVKYKAKNDNNDFTYSKKSEIDNKGKITKLTYSNLQEIDLEYDGYGNVVLTRQPASSTGRKRISFEYDNVLHSLPVKVTDTLGYSSSTEYDEYGRQLPIKTTDIGGSVMCYSYDSRGRIKSIKTLKDPNYTIKYDYWNNTKNLMFANCGEKYKQWVKTSHYNADNPAKDINVLTYSDAFGNIIYLKKDVTIGKDMDTAVYLNYTVYDCLGQPVLQAANPVIATTNRNTSINSSINIYDNYFEPYIQHKYDIWGREIKTTLPDNTEINTSYKIKNDFFVTYVTDALNQTSIVWKDVRGLQMQMQSPRGATTIFEYNGLGQLKRTIDPEGHQTKFSYDILGRTDSIFHPSRGLTEWFYDGATANVAVEKNAKDEKIYFEYDILGRPTEKHFSGNYQNDVYYEYGDSTAGLNAGKLIKLQDATGVTDFDYDEMGNVAKQVRMHILPNGSLLTHQTEWDYDSWGRTRTIIYPDGEQVNYSYNNAGNLNRVESNLNGSYINDIFYNKNEQKEGVEYGNTTFAQYIYDTVMNRLQSYDLYGNNGKQILMHKDYHYNDIGNIDVLYSDYDGIDILENYQYDADNRLDTAFAYSSNSSIYYNLKMQYSSAGKIINKNLTGECHKNGLNFQIKFVNDYDYKHSNPYAVSDLSGTNNDYLQWYDNGNLCYRSNQVEYFYWTEDNRMQAYYNYQTKTAAHYRYNASGERDLKLVGEVIDANINGRYIKMPYYDRATLYASNLMTIDYNANTNNTTYTKHYFAGTERILANVAGGGQANINPLQEIYSISGENAEQLSETFTNFAAEYFAKANENQYCCQKNDLEELPADLKSLPDLGKEFIEMLQMNKQDKLYWFNANHLGSGSLITDDQGELYQRIAFCPFGETLLSKSYGNYEERFLFGGKITDQESGLMYFEDRYYWAEGSINTSSDRHWYNYPHVTSYAFCFNNPVRFIDPTGMYPIYDPDGNFLGTDDNGIQGHEIVMLPENFKQGMSYKDAMSFNIATNGAEANERIKAHWENLSTRPDWDGYLTLAEANDWYRNGNGQPLFVDLSKIDMSYLYSKGEKYVGEFKHISLFKASESVNDALVYGTIGLTRYPNNQVRGTFDIYDFDMHNSRGVTTWLRNRATEIGQWVAGEGTAYRIYFNGSKTIQPLWPWTK